MRRGKDVCRDFVKGLQASRHFEHQSGLKAALRGQVRMRLSTRSP